MKNSDYMNNTSFHIWVSMQIEPEMLFPTGRPEVKQKRELIDAFFFARYNAENPLLTLREQEEREDDFLKRHNI